MARDSAPPAGSWTRTEAGSHLRGRRSRDTRPEGALRHAVHRLGLRYRLQRRVAPRCTADFVLPPPTTSRSSSTAASGTDAPSTVPRRSGGRTRVCGQRKSRPIGRGTCGTPRLQRMLAGVSSESGSARSAPQPQLNRPRASRRCGLPVRTGLISGGQTSVRSESSPAEWKRSTPSGFPSQCLSIGHSAQ
ncbi:very short patch repair endonuclease [Streptomyces albidoflavus]|nr:very short patch repair endonuclease [Streptomyces albidoflavus]